MAPRLVFHIGDFKTGTTILQHWLENGEPEGIAALPDGPHAWLVQAIKTTDGAAEAMGRIRQALEHSPADWLVVSSEHFEFARPENLLAALALHLPDHLPHVRILGWVRPHGQGLLARYAESVKIGNFTELPEAYVDLPATRARMSYANRFSAWREAFGAAVELQVYDRKAFPGGDIRRQFALTLTGRDPGPLAASAMDQNPTLGVGATAFLLRFHASLGPADPATRFARWTLGRHLGRVIGSDPAFANDPPLRLDAVLAARLDHIFQGDARLMDEEFFPDGPFRTVLSRQLADARDAPTLEDVLTTAPLPEGEVLLRIWGKLLADGLSTEDRARAMDAVFHERSGPFPPGN